MSLRPDGSYRCDRCGADVVNGSHLYAVTIAGTDPDDPTMPRVLHLCLDCQRRVLTKRALRDYYDTKG